MRTQKIGVAVIGIPKHIARPFRCTLSSTSHFPDCHTGAAYSNCGTTILLYNLTMLAGSIFSVFPKILRRGIDSQAPYRFRLQALIKLHHLQEIFDFNEDSRDIYYNIQQWSTGRRVTSLDFSSNFAGCLEIHILVKIQTSRS